MGDDSLVSVKSDGDMVVARAHSRRMAEDLRYGLVVIARDSGPGIRDIARAVETGFASTRGLGLGLPGARRLMDEFEVESEPGEGTTVTMTKWRMRDDLERLRERRLRREIDRKH